MTEQQLIDEGYAEGKKSFQFYAKEIGSTFDFKMVHKAMMATEWKWLLGTDNLGADNYGIPTLETMQNHAYSTLKAAYDTGNTISTGGFSAGWEDGSLYLTFTLEECSI